VRFFFLPPLSFLIGDLVAIRFLTDLEEVVGSPPALDRIVKADLALPLPLFLVAGFEEGLAIDLIAYSFPLPAFPFAI
jgi:hypothetical protein